MAPRSPAADKDPAFTLAFAVVSASDAPTLLLDGDLTVLAASLSFSAVFSLDPAAIEGSKITALGQGEWDVPQLVSLLNATAGPNGRVEAYEMALRRGAGVRNLILRARKLPFDPANGVRLLLTVADVTDARESQKRQDDLLREKTLLLQEVQHRIANSLQIISAVILQSARRAQSEPVKTHLQEAHLRVMSVAAVQRQLVASSLGDVQLRAYFTQLAQSLGASMIRDPEQLILEVDTDDTVVSPDVSVSLGLIVTELVINALKHAFSGHRHGRVLISYRREAPDWTLSVSDDGAGMPETPQAMAGLGTTIVEALARQLKARVEIAAGHPGTIVSIHGHTAAFEGVTTLRPIAGRAV